MDELPRWCKRGARVQRSNIATGEILVGTVDGDPYRSKSGDWVVLLEGIRGINWRVSEMKPYGGGQEKKDP